MWLNYVVIQAKIVTQEDLDNETSIQLPDITNMLIDNMTAMINIPTTIILRELERGMCVYVNGVRIYVYCVYIYTYIIYTVYIYIYIQSM